MSNRTRDRDDRRRNGPRLVTDAAAGAAAGTIATAAMTLAMGTLMAVSRGPFAPEQVTVWLLARADSVVVRQPSRTVVTLANHFSYGSMLGAVYGLLVRASRGGPPTGVAYGLGVWAANYAGILPKADVLPAPSRDDRTHAARIVLAHVVYGAVLGVARRRLGTMITTRWTECRIAVVPEPGPRSAKDGGRRHRRGERRGDRAT